MTKPWHALIDMDGVLCDFAGAALRLFNYPVEQYPPGEWDIPKVLGISDVAFYGTIDAEPGFWRDLKPEPWAVELVSLVRSLGLLFTISSKPAFDPLCAAQKIEWLREHILSGDECENYMLGRQKWLMANPGHLLIDDNELNVDLFRDRGGQAILVPTRFNRGHRIASPWGYLKSCLENLFVHGNEPQVSRYEACRREVEATEPRVLP